MLTGLTALAVLLASATPVVATDPAPTVTLEVLLLRDADFPAVTRAQAETILEHARSMLAEKLGYGELRFVIRTEDTVAAFLARHAPVGSACLESLEPLRARPGRPTVGRVDAALVERFLSRWRLEELRAFFPEAQRPGLGGYKDIAAQLLAELDRKVELIAGFKVQGGRSLLDPARLDERSYVRWVCAMREQDEADLILTNAFILYDLASEPYPHSIFQKNKVGGASLPSPKRRAIDGRAVFGSTFSMVTELPFFREEGVETLSDAERLEVIGDFIVAHELGHALFKLPDFYDHPRECLMTTKYETGYVSGYRDLLRYPGACGGCQPYIDARRLVFRAEDKRRAGDDRGAIALLRRAMKETPRHIDGNYWRYVADLSAQVAELHFRAGDLVESRKWADAVLRAFPEHPSGLALRQKLSPPPSADNTLKNQEK